MTTEIVLSTETITEGKDIAKAISKADLSFVKSLRDGTSIDVKLGKFLMKLNALADQHGLRGKAKSDLLKQAGVAKIDKQRRSEAVTLATNLTEIVAFIDSTKWKKASVGSLVKDWQKANKPTASDTSSEAGNSSKAGDSKAATGSIEPKSLDGQQLAMLILSVAKDRKAVEDMMAHLTAAMQRQDEKANNVVAIAV